MALEAQPHTEHTKRHSHPNLARIIVRSAFAAAVCLGGCIGFPFWYGLLVYTLSTRGSRLLEQVLPVDVLPDVWLPIAVMGGAAWGWRLARILSYPHTWRLVLACAVGVGIGVVLATRFLSPPVAGVPFHVRFAVQFVMGIGSVVIMTGVALGLALQSWRAAATLALVGSFVAAVPAGGVLVLLDLVGMRVGAGHANMAKVTVLGFLAATVAGGALFGWVLAWHIAPGPPTTRESIGERRVAKPPHKHHST